jgi:hypothetical protein
VRAGRRRATAHDRKHHADHEQEPTDPGDAHGGTTEVGHPADVPR